MRKSLQRIWTMMHSDLNETILQVLTYAPQWMRRDLESKDANARARAEETLAAMIANALRRENQNAQD
jgi:hypothetical protein